MAETSPVFAIGDPDQAIYGFRGSSPRWFYRFAGDTAAEQHVLRRNYRSGSTIVAAAASVIANNSHPADQVACEAMSGHPGRLHEFCAETPAGEAAFLVRRIEALIGGSSHREVERLGDGDGLCALGDIAVLYRTGRQAEALAGALSEHGLPVQVVDLRPFYLNGPAFPLYLWVQLAAGQLDSAGLLALLSREKGIGAVTLAGIERVLASSREEPWQAIRASRRDFSAVVRNRLTEMDRLLGQLRAVAAGEGLIPALRLVCARYGLSDDDGDVERLLHLAGAFGASLSGFAGHLQRSTDSVVYDPRADAVALMTLHASKGLEFRAVFLVGCEEGLLPLASRERLSPEEEAEWLEEERRLFFVGMTRAREMLCLTRVRTRSVDGRLSDREPSRFLSEIPPACFTPIDGLRRSGRRKAVARQLSLLDRL